MFYIVVEDSGSGKRFYENLRDNVWRVDNSKVRVVSSNGNKNLYATVCGLGLTGIDVLFCAYDNVADNIMSQQILKIEDLHKRLNFRLIQSNYYCFEELFLSFEYVDAWGMCLDNGLREVSALIRDYLKNRKTDYFQKERVSE